MICNGTEVWSEIFSDLKHFGKLCNPRGSKSIELEDYTINFNPMLDKFCSFPARNLSMKYIAGEFA